MQTELRCPVHTYIRPFWFGKYTQGGDVANNFAPSEGALGTRWLVFLELGGDSSSRYRQIMLIERNHFTYSFGVRSWSVPGRTSAQVPGPQSVHLRPFQCGTQDLFRTTSTSSFIHPFIHPWPDLLTLFTTRRDIHSSRTMRCRSSSYGSYRASLLSLLISTRNLPNRMPLKHGKERKAVRARIGFIPSPILPCIVRYVWSFIVYVVCFRF